MKPLIAYAVINKKKPKLEVNDIFDKCCVEELKLEEDEKIIKVLIKQVK